MMELFFVGENPKGLAKSDLERNPMNSTIQFYPVKKCSFRPLLSCTGKVYDTFVL